MAKYKSNMINCMINKSNDNGVIGALMCLRSKGCFTNKFKEVFLCLTTARSNKTL